MSGNLHSKKRSIILSWLISYVIVMLIPLLITNLNYINTAKVIEKEINNTNAMHLKVIKKHMDARLHDIETLSFEVAFNSRIDNLLKKSNLISDITSYDIHETVKDLNSYIVPSMTVDNFYVFFPKSDLIVSNTTSRDSKTYYDIYLAKQGIEYSQWHTIISASYSENYILIPSIDGEEKIARSIAFIRTIPLIPQGKGIANIVIILNESIFLEDIIDNDMLNKGELFVLDRNNHIIFSSLSDHISNVFDYDKLTGSNGLIHERIDNQKVVISYISSDANNWKYIIVQPESVFWEKSEYVRRLTFIGLGFCLLIGGFITYLALKRNYKPVNKLIRLLEKSAGLNFDRKDNEYSFIQEAIDKARTDREEMGKILSQQNKVLRFAFLNRLIKGKELGERHVKDALLMHDMNLVSDYFGVVVFYIDDFGSLFPHEEGQSDEVSIMENYKLVQFIVMNVIEELIGRKNIGFMTDADDMMACLVNFRQEGMSEAKAEISGVVYEAQDFIHEHFNIKFMAAASSIHKTFEGIHEAYNEALQTMEYKRLLGLQEIIHYEDIKELPKGDYYYPLEKEQQLINCIKTGDYEDAKIILEEIFEKNFDKSILSIDVSRCLMFNLVGTMIKTVNEIRHTERDDFLKKMSPVEKLLGCESVFEMKKEMIKILYTFCVYAKEKNKDKEKNREYRLKTDIEAFIKEHYADENLSITSIAEHFQVYTVYLSRIFREHSNENLPDYINRIRIEKVKQLIKQQYNNLEDLAKNVGYNNTKTLTRVFKKYVGVTPGKYKDSL